MSLTREMDHDAAGEAGLLEVPESSDNDSLHTAEPPSRATKGVCEACGAVVGDFFNSWIKVTGSYYLPALLGSYSSVLSAVGRQRPATVDSELDGCTIQALRCSCDETLGFHVVNAPDDKKHFRDRDFFKLGRIQLKCEEEPNKFVVVEPQFTTPDSIVVADSPDPANAKPPVDMEVDSRPSLPGPLHYNPHQHHHHHHQQQHRELPHQPLQLEVNKQSLPPPPSRSPPTPLPSNAPLKSPSNPNMPSPAIQPLKPVRETHHVLPPPREIIASPAHHTRELPAPLAPHHQSPVEQHPKDQNYPRSPHHVQLDAIERLQTQISQNTSALAAQGREMRHCEETMKHHEDSLRREFQTHLHQQSAEIRRVDDAVGRLQHEMRGIRELLEVLRREFHASGGAQGRGAAAPSVQDSALELMAQQIAVISAKANDVETLKITIEIMKNKIQRLETTAVTSPAQTAPRQYDSPREPAPRQLPPQHTVPSHHLAPSLPSQPSASAVAAQKMQSYDPTSRPHSRSVLATPETSQRVEPSPESRSAASGWATVNAGMKRTLSAGLNSPHDSVGPSPESPKRTKLAPIEPRAGYAHAQGQLQHVYDHMDTDDSDSARAQTHRHTLPSQPQSTMSVPESTPSSQHSHGAMISYSTQEAPSDDSWRPESQRIVHVIRTPRGRGSRGGPGSRGGRVRKSMAAQVHPISTPEWERVEWQGVPDSQVSPDGYYTMPRMNRPIVRRGSGGGGSGSRGGRPSSSSGRAASVSLGLQGVTAGTGVGLPADPYAHTKKTRTKPIRNADGVLIRKDGRPDMRSQSSAANLRKVHSRTGGSEAPEGHEREFTPSLQYTPNGSVGTSSPTGGSPGGHDLPPSMRKKHSDVMSRMFPGGIEESRKELDHTRKVFEENEDHTAHPRSQQSEYHHHHETPASRPLEIKREQMEEQRFRGIQSPNEDVDMDHADDEGQTPGGQSDNSGHQNQYHERVVEETQQTESQSQTIPASISAPAPESTADSPATLPPPSSTQTLAASSAQQS